MLRLACGLTGGKNCYRDEGVGKGTDGRGLKKKKKKTVQTKGNKIQMKNMILPVAAGSAQLRARYWSGLLPFRLINPYRNHTRPHHTSREHERLLGPSAALI